MASNDIIPNELVLLFNAKLSLIPLNPLYLDTNFECLDALYYRTKGVSYDSFL